MDILNIEYEKLISTPTGSGASTGRQTEEAFNDNFELTKQALAALTYAISNQIVSEEIRQFRVDTNTIPYIVYYSMDELTTADPTWYKLADVSFASLTGNPTDSIALKEILDSKGSAEDVTTLKNQMNQVNISMEALNNEVDTVGGIANTNAAAISLLQTEIALAVKTVDGGTIFLRYNAGTKALEYSINGEDWTNTAGSSVTFDNLQGNPADNEALVAYIADAVSGGTGGYVTTETFNGHAGDFGNPHVVTKEQVGLSNVQNYSPALMPLSDEAKAKFLTLETRFPTFEYVNKTGYDTFVPENQVYMISSHF